MPDADIAAKLDKVTFGENLRNQTHFPMCLYLASITNGDPGALLSTMLESEKSEKDKTSYVYLRTVDSKNATTFV